MENLFESNERTLDIFDSVCSGLASCLALVHADIRQMSEHREQLARQLELESELNERSTAAARRDIDYTETDLNYNSEEGAKRAGDRSNFPPGAKDERNCNSAIVDKANNAADDSLHLPHLRLLDKQLADSFSQALSLYDQRKSREDAGSNRAASQKPSLFQVLLGRGGNQNKSDKQQKRGVKPQKDIASSAEGDQQLDTRAIIDDISRQTRLAMQYSKQLEAHLFKVEDLRAKYEMHLKMGLVVKSVSRAYLAPHPNSSSSLAAGQLINQHSASSLGRSRNQHHSSSLLVNDRSSLGATTRSSMSSLNLSTWSFSRRQHSDRGSTTNSRKNLPPTPAIMNCMCQQSGGQNVDASNGYNLSSPIGSTQKCASTVSLDSISSRQRRHNLSKLISSSKVNQAKHHHNCNQEFYDPSSIGHNIECQCQMTKHRHRHLQHSPEPPLSPSPRLLDEEPQCGPGSVHRQQPPHQYVYGAPSEFATPTTTGTLAGGYVDANGAVVLGEQPAYIGSGVGSLHKSSSHSSLKKGGKQLHKSSLGHSQHQLASNGSKTTIKEFIDNIERIEAEFESYMGTFLMNIEDIQGFARVCQGDVFEINIKYGDTQKFKTKISVLKENRQKCENKQTVFKARIADVIAIKAYECKGLGKKVLLGHKLCETRDLFTARSQLMTISLNQTGSIKLNLVITWNPLHMTPKGLDISHISLPPTPISSSTLSSLSSARSSTNCGPVDRLENATTSVISVHQTRPKMSHDRHSQHQSPNSVHNQDECCGRRSKAEAAAGHHPRNHSLSSHIVISSRDHSAKQLYQDTEAMYAYHLPEPDYLTTGDLKY